MLCRTTMYKYAKNVLAWQFFAAEPQLFALPGLFTEEVVDPRSYATQTSTDRPTHTHTHTRHSVLKSLC